MKRIVFASWNPKKAAEMQRMAPEGIQVICLKDIPEAVNVPQAEENGTTFKENATIKAKYWVEKLNMPVLAEDSGIEIEALNGYPGVYTKRCIEKLRPGANVNVDKPEELYPILLELMAESGNASTQAQWVSAMAFIDSEREVFATEYLLGDMCPCAGERKFGFDQYFKPAGFDKTLSELDPEEKDNIGPRKRAFERILDQL
ncbi:MAG: non-canonical purine NTP pyrophosphatase [Clostridia bacterium]|nr:non-canonical purine NTP pyrophosphatase [Clostridia bacterium]